MVTWSEYMDFFRKGLYVLRLLQGGCCLKDIHLGFDTVWGQLTHFRGIWCLIQDEDCIVFNWRLMWFWVCNETFKGQCLIRCKLLQCVTWIVVSNPEDGIRMFIRNVNMNCFSIISKLRILSFKKRPLSPESVMNSSFLPS